MKNDDVYRAAMEKVVPSEEWRAATLAKMQQAQAVRGEAAQAPAAQELYEKGRPLAQSFAAAPFPPQAHLGKPPLRFPRRWLAGAAAAAVVLILTPALLLSGALPKKAALPQNEASAADEAPQDGAMTEGAQDYFAVQEQAPEKIQADDGSGAATQSAPETDAPQNAVQGGKGFVLMIWFFILLGIAIVVTFVVLGYKAASRAAGDDSDRDPKNR